MPRWRCKNFSPRQLISVWLSGPDCQRSSSQASEPSLHETRAGSHSPPPIRLESCVRLALSPRSHASSRTDQPAGNHAIRRPSRRTRNCFQRLHGHANSDLLRLYPQVESSPSSSRPRTMSRPSLPRVYSSSSTAGQSIRSCTTQPDCAKLCKADTPPPLRPSPRLADATSL